jgi:hypothetical protein
MVEQHDPPGPGPAGQFDRVLGGGMTERALGGHFLGEQLCVVD